MTATCCMSPSYTRPDDPNEKGLTMNSNTSKLLAVLQDYAPTGYAQQKCSEMVGEMFKDGLTTREIDAALAASIVDGIRHGNWPWTARHSQPHEKPRPSETMTGRVIWP